MGSTLPQKAYDALRFEEKILPNGLTLRLLPMPDYGAVHALYTTRFGSIDRVFEQKGAQVALPAGVAHFLEHKMFENADGVDAFTLYAQTGASANAYTSFDRTAYLFTAAGEIDKNLDILLSFVGHPHFTEATIEKEQGIIGQEIKMYEDNAELRCYFAALECLYHNHPVRDDIVGTVDTIAGITPDILYTCCDAYYNPSNMALCAAGNITMAQMEAAVARAGLPADKAPPTRRIFPDEPATLVQKERSFTMPVAMPLFTFAFKEAPPAGDSLKTEVVCDMLTELLAGETSTLYRRLYDEGLVQPSFSGEYGCYEGCLHFAFSGESEQPERVRELLLEEIARQRRQGVDAGQFELCRNMMYGEAIAELESVERVASLLSGSFLRRRTPADELAAIAALSVEDVQAALASMLREDACVSVIVRPGE